ncbi:MAG TPA: hypothetical protein PLY66_04540 [Acidobacteriota bacterium]|nr:hypothetical protein [Acidobacteriota bacterium]HOT00255.1 hypothetical protein [Acidobacteriota bacterium]HQF86877.1 hypothetical protein [Acidobacteriota bacterium]HQG91325.1 hypothetical protein [Acidobacteriota bacterium]
MAVSNPLLSAIRSGAAPKMIKLAAARGSLPLPPEILLEAQASLLKDGDPEIRQAAEEGLHAYSPAEMAALMEHKEITPFAIDQVAGCFRSNALIVEKIILNPNTDTRTLTGLAPIISQSLAELLINNQVRLIEAPEILASLRQNPNLSPGDRQRLEEIEHDFLGGTAAATPATAPAPVEESKVEDLPFTEEERAALSSLDADAPTAPSKEEQEYIEELAEGDQDKLTLYQKMATLSVSDKVKLALLGRREERALLIRDSNKLVSTSVLSSPKLTDSEIEIFAQLRNVSHEVLRIIGTNKELTKNYRVVYYLVRNPKAPVEVTMPLLNRLTSMDLKLLQIEKSVPESVRAQAKRIISRRQP